MRKEIILAIVLGVVLGLIIIFGINLANQSVSRSPQPTPAPTGLEENPLAPVPSLQITSPENNSVSFQNNLKLTGTAKPNSWIAVIWQDGQTIIKSDESGSFQQTISLIGGENIINITAADGADYQESAEITIIYTTASLPAPAPTTQETASSSAEQIQKSLIQRIQGGTKENILKGYLGVIAKINNLSLTVNTPQNQTLQVIADESTDIIRDGKNIGINDLSIEEKIIIMGNLSTEDILSAKRIVAVKTTTPEFTRQTLIAPVTHVKGRTLDIGELNVSIPKKSEIDPEKLQENQIVMAIVKTDLEDDTHILLTIQVI